MVAQEELRGQVDQRVILDLLGPVVHRACRACQDPRGLLAPQAQQGLAARQVAQAWLGLSELPAALEWQVLRDLLALVDFLEPLEQKAQWGQQVKMVLPAEREPMVLWVHLD